MPRRMDGGCGRSALRALSLQLPSCGIASGLGPLSDGWGQLRAIALWRWQHGDKTPSGKSARVTVARRKSRSP
jgi:hypothetical protein